jgi:FkbM family methyltransferase
MDKRRMALRTYEAVEAIIGRSLAWRVGRWLYLGARRELLNDPKLNGEYALQSWVVAESGANATFFDVGAHIGEWTASLQTILRDRAAAGYHIHAFEPAPAQFQHIRRRFDQQIKDRSIDVVATALAAIESEVPFYVTQPGISSLMAPESTAERILIEATTIDNYMAAKKINTVELIKIDTEGNDFNVILGACSALTNGRIKVIQFEYNWRWIPFGHTLRKVFAFSEEVGYRLGKLTANRIEIYDDWHPELDRFIETNFVMLHPNAIPKLPHAFMTFDIANVVYARSS